MRSQKLILQGTKWNQGRADDNKTNNFKPIGAFLKIKIEHLFNLTLQFYINHQIVIVPLTIVVKKEAPQIPLHLKRLVILQTTP